MPADNIQGFPAEVIAALKQLHSGIYRWPGGDYPRRWLEPAGGKLAFREASQNQAVVFVPLSSVVHERYSVYPEIRQSNS